MFERRTYLFDCRLKIREMMAALNQLDVWTFVERDSDRWGIYTSSCAERPGVAAVKILEEQGRYLVSVSYESAEPTAAEDWKTVLEELSKRLLPAIGATSVDEATDYE